MLKNSTFTSWTTEEDENLYQSIVSSLKRGGTITEGIKRFIRLNQTTRTRGACAFRWTDTMKKRYDDERKGIKFEPKQIKQPTVINAAVVEHKNIEHTSILFQVENLLEKYNELVEKNKELEKFNSNLVKSNEILINENAGLQNDINYYYGIFNRARDIQVQQESQSIAREQPRFKMDRNGNLERY